MSARVSRGRSAASETSTGPEEKVPPRRGKEQVRRRASESKSEGAELDGKAAADGRKVNLGYRLTLKRTDDGVRDAVGDYGSVEVSVSLHEDVPADRADEEFERLRDSVHAKVNEAFVELGLPLGDDEGAGGED